MVLPAGTTLPPVPYLVVLLGAVLGTAAVLLRAEPPIRERTVLALSVWMVAGATWYVVHERSLAPGWIDPLLSSPSVYGLAFVGAGVTWYLALRADVDPVAPLTMTGLLGAILPTAATVIAAESLAPVYPLGATVGAVVVAAVLWWLLRAWEPRVEVLGWTGLLTVFAHALDAFTTVLGVVHLGFVERTPLSRLLLELGAGMSVPVLGAGWLFVVVKLVLGVGVAWLLAPMVREDPTQGFLLLIVVIAVGLGPGVHNVLLFTVAG